MTDHPPSEWFPRPLLAIEGGEHTVYVALADTPDETIVWHWCPKNRRWDGAMIGLHTIVQRDPLTITASLYRPDCCGWHGWITGGRWVPA